MKSRDTLLRLKRFQVDEKRRRVAQIELMAAEFFKMASDLDNEVNLEEQRAGIQDMNHYAYPTYALAARTRRDNLIRSGEELNAQLEEAKLQLDLAQAELSKAQNLDGREKPERQETHEAKPLDLPGIEISGRGFRALGA